ncbi:RING/U-box superfamily protein [Wolffia australiana]
MASRQTEIQYFNAGFPYTVTESFMDLFEGLNYAQADTALSGGLHDQGNPYWPMMVPHSFKYSFPGSASGSSNSMNQVYDPNDLALRFEGGGRVWDSSSVSNDEESMALILHGGFTDADSAARTGSEDCIRTHHGGTSSHVIWQDNIDPDNMTYEELLDLGEAVGTQSRGLPLELIMTLPVTKHKCRLFSRKKVRCERCVICQMDYKRGDKQMTLPCNHVYHAACISRWLGINKACPVCFAEVLGDKPKSGA